MATALIDAAVDGLLGAAVDGLLGVLKNEGKKILYCKKSCKRLQKLLEALLPTLNEISHTGVDQPSKHCQQQLDEFCEKLKKGEEMVKECSKVHPLKHFVLYSYGKQIYDLEKYIAEFIQRQGWLLSYSTVDTKVDHVDTKLDHVCTTVDHVDTKLDHVDTKVDHVDTKVDHVCTTVDHVDTKLDHVYTKVDHVDTKLDLVLTKLKDTEQRSDEKFNDEFMKEPMHLLEKDQEASTLNIPGELPKFCFGLEISIDELKKRLLRKDVTLLGVVGMGGSGKTTLATAISEDIEVQAHFQKRIVFETVSKTPNIMEILGRMWDKIVGGRKPVFCDVDDARRQLQAKLYLMKPWLVVLDDIWKRDDLDNLLFKGEGYTTLITTRNDNIVISDQRYEKQLLELSHAVPLFCHWAFGQETIPETADYDLVIEVIAKCSGLPLALKVIGRSLYEAQHEQWMTAKDNLSAGQPVSDIHEGELLRRLGTSVDILDEKVRECFLDMVIFQEARKISADALLDLGVYVHGLKWPEAYTILLELANRNLVKLVKNQKGTLWNSYERSCDLSFFQHDVLRELAFYLTKQKKHPIKTRKRFIMDQKADSICKNAECPSDAEIVSFNTGSMEEKDWREMDFSNAKALILNISASEYFLPPFMQSMHKLEVLMIFNHNARRATLKGVSVFSSLTQLKVVQLEGVIVPPLQVYCQSWQQLQKLSLILCEGFENLIQLHTGLDLNFPRLLEFTIDHCIQLKELPPSICQMTSLQRLSVTNCHDLQKLPDDIEKLSSLKTLRLYACPDLKELPNSICKLRELEFLDISVCHGITQLPDELGQLSSLKKLDMRECSRVRQLPRLASDFRSQVRVICDKKIQLQWSHIIGSRKVEVAEEYFNLDWL